VFTNKSLTQFSAQRESPALGCYTV